MQILGPVVNFGGLAACLIWRCGKPLVHRFLVIGPQALDCSMSVRPGRQFHRFRLCIWSAKSLVAVGKSAEPGNNVAVRNRSRCPGLHTQRGGKVDTQFLVGHILGMRKGQVEKQSARCGRLHVESAAYCIACDGQSQRIGGKLAGIAPENLA